MCCTLIRNQPMNFVKEKVEKFKDLRFADKGSGDETYMLIGSYYYWTLLTGRVVQSMLGDGSVAMKTRLGWVVSGPVVGWELSDKSINVAN